MGVAREWFESTRETSCVEPGISHGVGLCIRPSRVRDCFASTSSDSRGGPGGMVTVARKIPKAPGLSNFLGMVDNYNCLSIAV
jgi:hypothetical protein